MRNQPQRSKSAANKHQKYRKQLRQKKHNRQQWVLRNVPEHKLYKRKKHYEKIMERKIKIEDTRLAADKKPKHKQEVSDE
tara:strand:- start:408 stop:647 length:240 start_codon:yes stop_codon:yes gene_type:complete